jgi:membrane protease YdiL (CAAX protease family)
VYALSFAAALTLGGVFAIGVVVSLIARSFPAAEHGLMLAVLVELAVYGAFAFWLQRDFEAPRAELGLGRVSLELLLLGAALGIALHGPADFVEAWVERWLPLPDFVLFERASRLSPSSISERAWLMLAAAGLVPLAEELFFRGALLAWVGRATTLGFAGWVSAACFTLSHAEPRSWPALGVVAGALGVLRWSSQSLLPCILLHATFNATTLAVIYAQPRESLGRSEPSWLLFGVGGVLSVALLLRAVRGRPKLSGSPA